VIVVLLNNDINTVFINLSVRLFENQKQWKAFKVWFPYPVMEIKKTCANCIRELHIGIDTVRVEEGVMGTKGFIPLEDALFFCCDRCLRDYFDIDDLPSVPRRMP